MAVIFNSLPTIPWRETSPYGPRNTGIKNASTFHKGIDAGRDFSKPETAILAVRKGKCIKNEFNPYRGWFIVLDHGDFQTLYQHLKEKSPIAIGEEVISGQTIGIMGASSDRKVLKITTHLHFELIVGGKQVDPAPYLKNIVKEDDEEVVKRIKVDVEGKIVEVDAINKENTNYVQLRDLTDILDISWDAVRKLPVIRRKK